MDFNKIQNQFASIEQVTDQYLNSQKKAGISQLNTQGLSFEEVLSHRTREITDLKFSKHAESRLNERNIMLSNDQMKRLNEGTMKAFDKGINESLVLVDSLAFIVNTKSNTVITALDSLDSNENVYTNIDGAVII